MENTETGKVLNFENLNRILDKFMLIQKNMKKIIENNGKVLKIQAHYLERSKEYFLSSSRIRELEKIKSTRELTEKEKEDYNYNYNMLHNEEFAKNELDKKYGDVK